VAIAVDKSFYLNAKYVPEHELAMRIEEAIRTKVEKIVLIKADEGVDYSAVMAAMDQLRQAGIEDIGLITERRNAPGAEGAPGVGGN
jgi:biopolymer transport protein ExbD/biopolymer transport protein TolR